jgi:enoyl-CoA hydratase/carnithine racemase
VYIFFKNPKQEQKFFLPSSSTVNILVCINSVRIDVAKELTMTGKVITGTEAAELGLVTRCVEDPMEEAILVAKQICKCSPDSVAATKRLFQDTWVSPEQKCLNLESTLQRQLLASARNIGWNIPYVRRRKDWESITNRNEEHKE